MNPYAIIAALIIWAASLAGVGYWQNGVGHVEEGAAWQKKENRELADANAKILQLETDARASEQSHSEVRRKQWQGRMGRMIDSATLIEALQAYRKRLMAAGHTLKAAAVAHSIAIVKRMD
jgi:hypothetical protein